MASPLIELGDDWLVLSEDITGMRPYDGTPPGGSIPILFQMETDGTTPKAVETWVLLSSAVLVGSPIPHAELVDRWKETLEIASGQISIAGHKA